MLICFEGIAGSGKTTQIELLADHLIKVTGREVLISSVYEGERRKTVSNFMNVSGIKLNQVAIMFLFQALHTVQYNEVIKAIDSGKVVIADRWRYSFFAHHLQENTIGSDKNLMNQLDFLAYKSLEPDICFLLDVPPLIAHERYLKRENSISDNGLELMNDGYFHSVSQYYNQLARTKGWRIVDGSRDPQDIFHEIRDEVDQIL